MTVDLSANNKVLIASLFRGSVNIGSAVFFSTGGARPNTMAMSVVDLPASTSAQTYSMRVGGDTVTWYINSVSAGTNLGGALVSDWMIREIV